VGETSHSPIHRRLGFSPTPEHASSWIYRRTATICTGCGSRHAEPATVERVNRLALGLCCLGGVLLWFATDRVILLILGLLLGVALGIGLGGQKRE